MSNVFSQPGPVDQYLRYLAEGQFKLQRSKRSGEYIYYPSAFGTYGASDELEWVEVSGRGTVYSVTTVRRPAKHGGDYNTSIVQLDEGPRMLTRVLGIEPDSVKIGMKVSVKIEKPVWDDSAAQPLVVFYPQAK
jgi:uncharacterized OB-fold protein